VYRVNLCHLKKKKKRVPIIPNKITFIQGFVAPRRDIKYENDLFKKKGVDGVRNLNDHANFARIIELSTLNFLSWQ
jgi:hypothetical protein